MAQYVLIFLKVEVQERHRATKPYLNTALPDNHTILVNSSLTLSCEVIPPYDDTSPPIISWIRHHRDSWTNDESQFGKKGFNTNGKSRGFRLVDEHNNPKFDELQKCAINGICHDRVTLENPLEYTLRNITKKDEGWYSCMAQNNFGVTLSSGYLKVINNWPTTSSKISKAQSPHIYVFVGGGTVFILSSLVVFIYCLRYRKNQRLKKEDLKIAQNINPVTKWVRIEQPASSLTGDDASLPILWPSVKIDRVDADLCMGQNGISSFGEYGFDPDVGWEIDRSRIKFKETVGEGEFGRVDRAILDNKTNVAVKMLKEGHTDSDVVSLVQEMVVMKQMQHNQPNIIRLVGACTQPIGHPLYVVVEFAEFGNLKDYLNTKKPLPRPPIRIVPELVDGIDRDNAYEIPVSSNCGSLSIDGQEKEILVDRKELHNISWQVAKGMAYLAQRKFVHRDLAARNILVCSNNVYKIADFGMARPIRHKDYYRRTSSGKVPLKWMAPESILDGIHTTQSDVWSYGILLWEIFSYGDSPLGIVQQMGGIDIFREYLKQRISLIKNAQQYMMERPTNMTNEIHNLMAHCWNFDPGLRPTWPKIEENTRTFFQLYQPREYLAMASRSTPVVKKGSLTRGGRNRVDSTSSRLTESSVSICGTLLNTTAYMGETAPLIRCSTGLVQ